MPVAEEKGKGGVGGEWVPKTNRRAERNTEHIFISYLLHVRLTLENNGSYLSNIRETLENNATMFIYFTDPSFKNRT